MSEPKFLNGLTDRAREYYNVSCKMMEKRIKNRMADKDEDSILEILDDLWHNANDTELQEIENLPRMWWFQDVKYFKGSNTSELDVYPYAQYFVKQRPHLLGDTITAKGKPYFGDKWTPNTAYLVLMIQKESNGGEDLELVTMSNEHYVQLQNEYEFLKYSGKFPVFKKKSN